MSRWWPLCALVLMLSASAVDAEEHEAAEPAEPVQEDAARRAETSDEFIPTEQLRFDQEVDYPVDI